jgi:hypothetical protein
MLAARQIGLQEIVCHDQPAAAIAVEQMVPHESQKSSRHRSGSRRTEPMTIATIASNIGLVPCFRV